MGRGEGNRDRTCAEALFEASMGERGRGVPSGPARSREAGAPASLSWCWCFRSRQPAPPSVQRACATPAGVCGDCGPGICCQREGPALTTGSWRAVEVGQGERGVWGERSRRETGSAPQGNSEGSCGAPGSGAICPARPRDSAPALAWAEPFSRGTGACCPRSRAEALSRAVPPGAGSRLLLSRITWGGGLLCLRRAPRGRLAVRGAAGRAERDAEAAKLGGLVVSHLRRHMNYIRLQNLAPVHCVHLDAASGARLVYG